MSKYSPLRDYLASRPRTQAAVTLSFRDIDDLVGGLPPSVRTLRTWGATVRTFSRFRGGC